MVAPPGLTVRAVHFDLDGVLVDSRDSIARAWRRWAGGHGLDWSQVEPHVAGRLAVDTVRAVLPGLGPEEAQAEADRVNAHQVADADDRWVIPGMPELVGAVAAHAWSVVTAAPAELALARLARCGFPHPDVLVSAADVTHGKPHPEPYLLASERLGVRPEDCLVVEDSASGIAAGLACGAWVVAVARDGKPAAPGAHAVARDGRSIRVRGRPDGRLVVTVESGDAPR